MIVRRGGVIIGKLRRKMRLASRSSSGMGAPVDCLSGSGSLPRIFRGWRFSALAIEDAQESISISAAAASEEELLGLHGCDHFGGGIWRLIHLLT